MLQSLIDKLAALERRFNELMELMSQPEIATDHQRLQALAKERASLEDTVSKFREHQKVLRDIEGTRSLMTESKDEEMTALAKQELEVLEKRLATLEEQLRSALLPKDPNDQKDIIVEIRAGTGGEEAGMFAADLYRMYSRYAALKGWQVEVIDSSESGVGGFKEIVFEVRGKGAYSRLKHESGVHRVQRVPTTEASGRIHTSTATVAVMPEADEIEVNVSPEDLRIDIYHASGHGGQNVQKVSTAVRIVHIPTGIVAACQDERSQLKNKQKAMAVLRARLFEKERSEQEQAITETRRSQVGTAERSEKIRTYNFPQDRLTDHRVGLTMHNLPKILEGEIDELINALVADEQSKRMEEALA